MTAEVCNLFPQIEKQLTDLMKRIALNDAALADINRKLPSGADRLASVDETARGRAARMLDPDRRLALDLTKTLRLPRFELDPLDPYACPSKGA